MASAHPHRRWNPLDESWVLVSPHRSDRPWQGERSAPARPAAEHYDPHCYLCPGNTRANGTVNPAYPSTYVFDNDFPALLPDGEEGDGEKLLDGIIHWEPVRGLCRVVCYSPDHGTYLSELPAREIVRVIDAWGEQYAELSDLPFIRHVLIFENRGEMMGASNPHPHGQIWATESVPDRPLRAAASQRRYFERNGKSLLGDYLEWEKSARERVIHENASWCALVPYWAVWPFECMIIPKRDLSSIPELSSAERGEWAAIIQTLAKTYDALFETPFPYSMGIYQLPCDGRDPGGFRLHQVFLPPLLRSATVRKHMVGYELCAEPQRDLTPEAAARRLREARDAL